MPQLTGTSTGGYQTVGGFLTLSVAQFELLFSDPPSAEPKTLGYYYINALDVGPPFQGRILARGIVSNPGFFAVFPGNYQFTAVRYSLYVRWKVSGKTWKLNYQ